MLALDSCTADAATAVQTAGSRDLRSTIVSTGSGQLGPGCTEAITASACVTVSMYIFIILRMHAARSTVSAEANSIDP